MKKLILATLILSFFNGLNAEYLLVPMDNSQSNHLKAYGLAFQSLKTGGTVQWLLNYRGGSFLLPDNPANEALITAAAVVYENLNDNATQNILNTVLSAGNGMNLVSMNKLPKIAVYAPPYDRHYDDAVLLAMDYAGIDYTRIYDAEVMSQDLAQYDWIHLDHEDFTGQYNKWQSIYATAPWYKSQASYADSVSKAFGFKKASQLKLAVAKKFRSYVENGGQLFVMCKGTETLDAALAAEGTDIVPLADGDPADPAANQKLNYSGTFAFRNFTVNTDPNSFDHTDLGVRQISKKQSDKFTIVQVDAKQDLLAAMLVQNHQHSINEFLGNTIAFQKQFIKPGISLLGGTAADVKYLHGQRGKGYFTFYAGHDPECWMHLVGSPATNIDNFRQSPGYRLILNNVLSPSVKENTLAVGNASLVSAKVYPNPFVSTFSVEISAPATKQVTVEVFSLDGQLMITDNISSENGQFSKLYSADNLSSGLYLVVMSNSNGVLSKALLSKNAE